MIVRADSAGVTRAAQEIRAGRLVAFPTETVYGLGADALNDTAVRQIFTLKGRPPTNPLIVHLAEASDLARYVRLPSEPADRKIIDRLITLWPGPLSIVFPKLPGISRWVTAGQETVAIRVPRHPVALALLRESGVPIAAPSANRSMTVSPTTAQHVADGFGKDAPLILDGGPCEVGLESTVVTVQSGRIVILRHGGITQEQLSAVGEAETVSGVRHAGSGDKELLSPGLLTKHYAPQTPLIIREPRATPAVPAPYALIKFSEDPSDPLRASAAAVECLSVSGDEEEIARRLFAALRALDQLGLSAIVVDSCEEKGLGRAIMDRLRRGAAAHSDGE